MAKFLDKHGLSTYESSIKERLNEKQDVLVSGDTIKTINNESLLGSGNITISAGGGTMTDMRVNGTSVVTDNVGNLVTESAYNSSTNKIATMADVPTIPTKTSDLTNDSGFITKSVNNLTNYELKTDTGNSIELSLNTTTYVMTLNLKNSAGTTISTDTIDLPLESVVVDGSYDSTNKKIVLELENGSTIDIPVADLINGLQTEITSSNKLSSDLVDDTNKTNKFVTAAEKTTWNNKSDFSGDYDDLTNKPTIPSEVTESTVSGWGFTKNTGTYSKPSGGIPKTDLASAVQTSLGKADTALQSYTETDPVFMGSPAANILTSDITHWNNKQDELVSGTNIKTINNQSILGNGDLSVGSEKLPIGSIKLYAGTTAPDGYLFCNGQEVSRTTYDELFAVIGTTYGAGDGSTTFNLPNLKGRVAVGLDGDDTDFDSLGATGGEKEHTLTVDEIPSHHHTLSPTGRLGNFSNGSGYTTIVNNTYGSVGNINSSNVGGSAAHNIMQPYITLNYIIKASKASMATLINGDVHDSYNTSTTNSYSCNYLNSINDYSTNEVNTGKKWINRKPVYRMTFDYTIQTGTNAWHNIGTISNAETLVIKELFVVRESQIYLNLYNNYNFYFENNTLKEQHSFNYYEGYHLYITVEYTKTTD